MQTEPGYIISSPGGFGSRDLYRISSVEAYGHVTKRVANEKKNGTDRRDNP